MCSQCLGEYWLALDLVPEPLSVGPNPANVWSNDLEHIT